MIPGRAGDPIRLANRKSRARGLAKQQAHWNSLFLITGAVCVGEHVQGRNSPINRKGSQGGTIIPGFIDLKGGREEGEGREQNQQPFSYSLSYLFPLTSQK